MPPSPTWGEGRSTRHRSRDAFRPSFASCFTLTENGGRREDRVPARTRGPSRRKLRERREDHRYRRNHTGLPCAVVYGLYALSPVNHPVCHRRRPRCAASSPTWRRTLGRQDHTISLVRDSAAPQSAHRVHRIPRSTFVTFAIAPLQSRRDDDIHNIDSVFRKTELFLG